MPKILKGARPIIDSEISAHYQKYCHKSPGLPDYVDSWTRWLESSSDKKITGTKNFTHAHFVQGTSQTFDHFVLRHARNRILALPGEFQYHRCIGQHADFCVFDHATINKNDAVIVSLPFSDTGRPHHLFESILDQCNQAGAAVCLDLAYWGITKDIVLDLDRFPCVQEFTISLSKPFHVLETHRVGIRFSREYVNDGICMQNEVGSINFYSMGLGMHFLDHFSPDWVWTKYQDRYYQTCETLGLSPTDTVIFAMGDRMHHQDFNRGVPGQYRVCISEYLSDL